MNTHDNITIADFLVLNKYTINRYFISIIEISHFMLHKIHW